VTDLIEETLHRLGEQLSGRLSLPGDDRYTAATAIWAKPVGRMPRAVAHCRTPEDVQSALRAARNCDLPLSVRGGGHDWAGRALCAGLVIDLSGMNGVAIGSDHHSARISGGARASDVAAVADPLRVAAVAGSYGGVGMAGFTLGGGYGALIGRFGLALDNLIAAEVVLADGRLVVAQADSEEELFWALRGGGGNFGVVTTMHYRLHDLPSVRSGMLIYPFSEARAVLAGCADIAASAPEELTVQLGCVFGPDDAPVVMVVPTWCGRSEEGEARVAPFLKVGTLLAGGVDLSSYGASLTAFDAYIVNGQTRIDGDLLASCARQQQHWRLHRGECRRGRRPSAFAATMCSSKFSQCSPIARTSSRSIGIANGLAPPSRPSMRWRFLADIRTSWPRATRTVQ
jgi:FAD/FMN-containing dehydrogenase